MNYLVLEYEISKARRKKKRKIEDDEDYRESYLSGLNPRSETYVRRGPASAARRILIPTAGGVALGPVGSSAALWRNISSGDTVSYNRKTGKKAKGKLGFGDVNFNLY